MQNIKKCPKCLKENDINAESCSCGFKFYIKPVVDEIAPTNTVIIDDPTPIFLWQLISFILPPLGFFFYFKWDEKWENRAKACGKMSLTMSIVWFAIGIIWLCIAIGVKNGSVLV